MSHPFAQPILVIGPQILLVFNVETGIVVQQGFELGFVLVGEQLDRVVGVEVSSSVKISGGDFGGRSQVAQEAMSLLVKHFFVVCCFCFCFGRTNYVFHTKRRKSITPKDPKPFRY